MALVKIKMLAFSQSRFTMLQKHQKKRSLNQKEQWELSSFGNMVAIIDIDASKILEQITRLKIGKKLRTTSLNSKFTSSYKKSVNQNLKLILKLQ